VILLRIVVDQLVRVGEVQAGHTRPASLTIQFDLGEIFGELAAHRAENPVKLGIVADRARSCRKS